MFGSIAPGEDNVHGRSSFILPILLIEDLVLAIVPGLRPVKEVDGQRKPFRGERKKKTGIHFSQAFLEFMICHPWIFFTDELADEQLAIHPGDSSRLYRRRLQ